MSTSETPTRTRFDSLQQEAFLNLWRTYDRLRVIEEEVFAPLGLSAQQYNALRLLASVNPDKLPSLALGAKLISRSPDMTRMLDRLEVRGLVARERKAENRRVVAVGITDKGLKLLDELEAPLRQCHLRQLGHLDEDDLRRLVDLLATARRPHEDPDNPWPRET
ncbi:MAG: MarR family transcriptional regulator [Planctomycetia bacterium]|nr:MarR family transcriptional regulator [Planctomycetia bacterium]